MSSPTSAGDIGPQAQAPRARRLQLAASRASGPWQTLKLGVSQPPAVQTLDRNALRPLRAGAPILFFTHASHKRVPLGLPHGIVRPALPVPFSRNSDFAKNLAAAWQ